MATEHNELGLRPIRRAIISVSDKTGIVDFARELKLFDVEIISTGGTGTVLQEAGIEVRDVSNVTGFPEMMDGRVKTLHPIVHGALLGLRDKPEHASAMRQHKIEPIDLVVVNLYPFERTIAQPGVTLDEAIEQIDIGGPAMIRSAAKNFRYVTVVTSPSSYEEIIDEMTHNGGALSLKTRSRFACEAFASTCFYDRKIFAYLAKELVAKNQGEGSDISGPDHEIGNRLAVDLDKLADLRYGENPHQDAAIFVIGNQETAAGIGRSELLGGKEMSFNNYVDADAAWQLIWDLDETACAIIKHTNPAGAGLGLTNVEAYRKALATDPVSAFGGIVAFNRMVDEAAARAVIEIFTEVVIAPDYEADALEVLRTKKNLRIVRARAPENSGMEYRQISGGMLVQTRDTHELKRQDIKVVTKRTPTEEELRALLFAWTVCKHTKSNAIVYARDGQTVGIGAGQMSRIDSVKIGAMRAQLSLKGSVLASDAFFPFRDGIDEASRYGITAVIQPGGSVRDEEVTAAADEHGLTMVFTGVRHFKH